MSANVIRNARARSSKIIKGVKNGLSLIVINLVGSGGSLRIDYSTNMYIGLLRSLSSLRFY